MDLLQEQIKIFGESVRTGPQFANLVKLLARKHKPDLIWIDPLMSFLGDDISSQAVCSKFLRNMLNPVAQEYGFCYQIIHHTGKPAKQNGGKPRSQTDNEEAYLGIGSSELVNWARAVMVLKESDGAYELKATKRGQRAGLVNRRGHSVRSVKVQHSPQGICWIRTMADDEAQEEKKQEMNSAALATVLTKEFVNWEVVADLVRKQKGLAIAEAKRLVKGITAKFGLDDLDKMDGERECGLFLAKRNQKGTLLLKLNPGYKPPQSEDDDEEEAE